MKKIVLLLCAIATYGISFAQTIEGSDMENWRTNTSGSSTPTTVQAPYGWYGVDSIIIGLGQSFGIIIGTTDADWRRNLFREDVITHSGSHSAKVMTMLEDTLLLPGVLSTAQTHVGITFLPTPGITGITFTGGNPVTVKPTTVSAWVQYFPGKDDMGVTGNDSGSINVQALSHIGGKDSVIGTGTATIGASSSWVQVTVAVSYTDNDHPIDTMRIAFTSSARPSAALDSSTLYVDDVSMTSVPNPVPADHTAVGQVGTGSGPVSVYPNPATGVVYFSGTAPAGSKAVLYSMGGQVAATAVLTGQDKIDVSLLPAALYFYAIYDAAGNAVQRGKVAVQ